MVNDNVVHVILRNLRFFFSAIILIVISKLGLTDASKYWWTFQYIYALFC